MESHMLTRSRIAVVVAGICLAPAAAWAQGDRTGYASVNGLELHYETHSSGPPLVLLHGALMGGGIALELAMRHPDLVRKLVVAAAAYSNDGIYPEVLEGIENLKPEDLAGSPWQEAYAGVAQNPEDWPDLGGLPRSQLAVLPGTTHVTLVERTDWLASMVSEFLDAPMPKVR
jgi:pimeloyl-ACP methyl ester carboxylesterase